MSTAAGPLVWHRFETLHDASEALAEAVAIRLRVLLDTQGRALLCVPGGTTPARFLASLGDHDLAWDKVTLLPTDERFVAPDDVASNERMIRENFAPLLDGRAAFLSFHGYGSDIEAAASTLGGVLSALPPIDLLVCGMGTDGHIASLFPGGAPVAGGDGDVVMARPPGLPPRLSLSAGRLAGVGWACLLAAGGVKEAVLKAAPERAVALPVDLLLERPQGLDVYWAKA